MGLEHIKFMILIIRVPRISTRTDTICPNLALFRSKSSLRAADPRLNQSETSPSIAVYAAQLLREKVPACDVPKPGKPLDPAGRPIRSVGSGVSGSRTDAKGPT